MVAAGGGISKASMAAGGSASIRLMSLTGFAVGGIESNEH